MSLIDTLKADVEKINADIKGDVTKAEDVVKTVETDVQKEVPKVEAAVVPAFDTIVKLLGSNTTDVHGVLTDVLKILAEIVLGSKSEAEIKAVLLGLAGVL